MLQECTGVVSISEEISMILLYDVCIKVLITSGFVLNKHDISSSVSILAMLFVAIGLKIKRQNVRLWGQM